MQDYRVMKERLFELMQWHTQIFSSKSTPVFLRSTLYTYILFLVTEE